MNLRSSRLTLATTLLALALTATGEDLITVRGSVWDPEGRPAAEVAIFRTTGEALGSTDADGEFVIDLLPGTHEVEIRHSDYATARREITVSGQTLSLEIELLPKEQVFETLTVSALRADDATPVTKKTLEAAEIEKRNFGQDVPFLLTHTPSITSYSDSGIGNNYSYFSLRGISQTRINMTLDGAPLNDPAENALFFSNFTDFASSIDSIQIQRGVGTSSVGSPSYGGSINFASVELTEESETHLRIGLGSFGTQRGSVAYQSGALENGLAFYGRVSVSDTDGYRDRSGVEQHSVFVSAAHRGEKSQLKLTAFSGRERSQLAFLAVEPEVLRENPRFNPLAEEETDDFGQDFAQLHYTRALAGGQTLTASLYYNGAQGAFRLWDDQVAQNDLLDFSIDGHFIGSLVTLSQSKERLSLSYGIHVNDFKRDHFLHIRDQQQYRNTGFKNEANAFLKAGYDLGPWHLFGDAQIRHADFRYQGDLDLGSVNWTFFDPKLGARYRVSGKTTVYASIGKASREPTRMDLLAGEDNATVLHDLEAVNPERVVDFEAGVDFRTPGLTLSANLYAMEFRDEIAATGELSDIGLPLRRNVDRSSRRGLEIDLQWQPALRWRVTHSSSFSRNRIREWTQFYDVFDPSGNFLSSEPRIHRDVAPLLTPEVIINQGIEYDHGNGRVSLSGRYVGDSQLDNTDNPALRAPSYFQLDFAGSIHFEKWRAAGRPKLTLHVDNLLDTDDLYPSGFSYLFFTRDAQGREIDGGTPFFYPLATRSVVATLDFKL